MNIYNRIKQMSVDEMANWLEDYTRMTITTVAKQLIEATKPLNTDIEAVKDYLLQECEWWKNQQ